MTNWNQVKFAAGFFAGVFNGFYLYWVFTRVSEPCHRCVWYFRNLSSVQDREICCYSISCKEQHNIGTSQKCSFTI